MHAVLFWTLAVLVGTCAIGVVVTQNIVRSATWLLFTLAGTAGIFFLLGADFVAATQLLVYVGGTLVLVVFGVMLTAQGPFINLKAGAVEWALTAVVGFLLFGVLAVCLLGWPIDTPDSARRALADLAATVPAAEARAKSIQDLEARHGQDVVEREAVRFSMARASNPDDIKTFLDSAFKIQLSVEAIQAYQRDLSPAESTNSAVLGEALLGIKEATPPARLSSIPREALTRPGTTLQYERKTVAYLLPFEIVSVHLLVVLIGAAYLARAKRRRGGSLP